MDTLDVQRVPWPQFLTGFGELWKQGEHVTCIGATGRGKTTLLKAILPIRDYTVLMAAKPKDPIINEFAEDGYYVTREYPFPEPREVFPKIIYWPASDRIEMIAHQREAFRVAMLDLYEQGKWCVVWDDARYMSETLNLRSIAEIYWQMGRSLKLSFVINTQRPYWIPLTAYDQATHLFLWADNDERNLARLADMVPNGRKWVREVFAGLDRHDFVYVNTREEIVAVSKVDAKQLTKVVA